MKPLLQCVDAVLFDLDGTLVETNIDFSLMKREMVALAVSAGVAAGDVQSLDILAVIDAAAEFVRKAHGDAEATSLRSRALGVLEEIEFRHAQQTTEIPLAREFTQRLREHRISTGIVTRNCRAASVLSLGIVGIEVDILICREDTKNHKPHPEPISLALSRLKARAGNSIMVGDHTMDMCGGRAAGTKTIGFLRPDRPDDFFDSVAPDFVARDLREVMDAIIDRDS